MTAMKNTLFFLFALAAVPSFAQTCGHNCPRRQAEPEIRMQSQQRRQEPEFEPRRREPEPEERPERRRNNNNVQPGSANVIRHARNYNTRPGGVHITPDYFAAHFGRSHGFHFDKYAGGPCIGDCGLRVFRGEAYFTVNGGWFGIVGPMPGNWGFQTDYLYIDIGDDGNYYLYDAQFPGVAVQLTFVQNVGDDQVGDDEDQDDESN
jgi:hypothetical protein